MRKGLMLCLIAAAAMGMQRTANDTAWFGTPVPPSASDPRKPVIQYDRALAPLQPQFPHRRGRFDELLDGAALKRDQKTIIDFSLESLAAGDKLWGRRAATPAFRRTIEWVVGAFKAAGLADARAETYTLPVTMWVPKSWQVQVVGDAAFGAGTDSVTLQSAFPQPGSATIPAGTLTAPVVYVGHGTDADLAGRDLRGKIAVLHVRPEASLFGSAEQGVAATLTAKGAVGVINAVEGPGNMLYVDPRFACGTAPCFMVGGQDAWFLQQVIGKAANAGVLDRLKMTLALASDEQGGLVSANGVATIPGESNTRIIISAHADGYFQGADDNASGVAVLVGLARYFAKQPKPKRTLMFVASGGHHGPGLGPAALVAAHPELKNGTLLILNLEHVASTDVVRGRTRSTNNIGMDWETTATDAAKGVGVTNESPFLIDLWARASRCYGIATSQLFDALVPGDLLAGYAPLGAPMTQMIYGGAYYHSSGDVLETVPAAGLERAARFHAFFVEGVDQAPEQLIRAGKGAAYQPKDESCR